MTGIEGLWVFRVQPEGGTEAYGAGVIVFETGRIFGGDHGFYWVGAYENVGGGNFAAKATVTNHNPEMTMTVWGERVSPGSSFHLEGVLALLPDGLLQGWLEAPGAGVKGMGLAKKVADLP